MYGESLESPLLRERCGKLAVTVQPSDVGIFLYLIRPEDVPCAIFCNASQEVNRAVSGFLEYVSNIPGRCGSGSSPASGGFLSSFAAR